MNFIFKLLLTVNATSWMIIIYLVKEKFTIANIPYIIFVCLCMLLIVLLSLISILLTNLFNKEELKSCRELSLADGTFLPIYLGYFFVSVSISDTNLLIFVYIILFVFTLLSQTQYFNPIFLLFGYHYYNITTENGTKIFVIKHGKVIRNTEGIKFNGLRRINDTTYIDTLKGEE